jgi:hypothetical protein
MKEFIESIMNTLRSNGFPEKRVSLPTEKMYEVSETKGFSFNTVLEQLKVEHSVEASIGPDKIVFSQVTVMNKEDMIKQAQEMMSQMDPEELRKLQEMFTNMSPEQKEEILKKGKDLGLI